MTNSESDDAPPPQSRKRSRTSGGGEDAASKKSRGRPRVDTQDETAADRRRTQIRLAQRAYRQRKETTISSLKERNTRLQSIIDQMNKSFLRFNDTALKSGLLQLNPRLGHELKQTMEAFVMLAKSATEGSDVDEEGDPTAGDSATEGQSSAKAKADNKSQTYEPEDHSLNIGWGYSASLDSPVAQASSSNSQVEPTKLNLDMFLRNTDFTKPTEQSLVRYRKAVSVGQVFDQSVPWQQPIQTSTQNEPQLPFGLVDLLSRQESPFSPQENPSIWSVNIPTPDVTPPLTRLPTPPHLPSLSTKTLKPAWTYSHDEVTFARRLTRSALETGFHLLSAANQRPAALNYVFKLSLPYMSLNELRERFKEVLARGTDEELDNWDTPFIHLGGAGTHYPRKDAKGNIIPLPNAWTVRRIGPISAKMIRAEHSTDPSQSHDLNIDLTGFEGEWFDAHDVEGYLQHEKGCQVDPKASFAEVLIDDDTFAPADLNSHFFGNRRVSLGDMRRSSDQNSDAPSLSAGSSASSNTTPTHKNGTGNNIFGQSDAPFGLDMGLNLPTTSFPGDFSKFPEVDPSTLYDQPLGLDLAPGFDINITNQTSLPNFHSVGTEGLDMGSLGLDLMGGSESAPFVRRKQRKAAWIDVSKLIDEIIKHGVCLGRAPGFRRKDVDAAFQAALITAF